MENTNYISKEEFSKLNEDFNKFKEETNKRLNEANDKTTDILINVAQLSTSFDSVKEKVSNIDEKIEMILGRTRKNIDTILISAITGVIGCIITYVLTQILK